MAITIRQRKCLALCQMIFKLLLSLGKLSYGLNRVKTYEFDQFRKKHLQDFMIGYKRSNATFFH